MRAANRRTVRQFTQELPVDLLFQDQCGARRWSPDFNPASPTPTAYIEGLLSMVEEDSRDVPLATEDGWDRVSSVYATGTVTEAKYIEVRTKLEQARAAEASARKSLEDCTVKGMTISAPGFYGPQGRQLRVSLAVPDINRRIMEFNYCGQRITNYEMESSCIAGLALHMGHKAMTVCCIIAQRKKESANTDYKPRMKELVSTVLERF